VERVGKSVKPDQKMAKMRRLEEDLIITLVLSAEVLRSIGGVLA
jgi:hypothetical protein